MIGFGVDLPRGARRVAGGLEEFPGHRTELPQLLLGTLSVSFHVREAI
jgi:hypothetical protein